MALKLLPCFPKEVHEARSIDLDPSGRSVNPERINRARRGQPNRTSTTRFTPLTWLPKSLFHQFQRAANIYFLIVSVLTCFSWAPFAWYVVSLPFAIVIFLSALKDLYEDMRRRRDDKVENSRTCWRFDFESHTFTSTKWSSVLCGDLVFTPHDEMFPADLFTLYASGGIAFISTANLDGETNLKDRYAPGPCVTVTKNVQVSKAGTGLDETRLSLEDAQVVVKALQQQSLSVSLAAATMGLAEITGTLRFGAAAAPQQQSGAADGIRQCDLNYEHLLPRGCVLRNTPWALAIVGYTGDDTKTRMNVAQTVGKFSSLQKLMNRCIVGIVIVEFIFCLIATITNKALGNPLNDKDDKGVDRHPIIVFCVYWIIIYHVLPISLYVCFEIIKLILGHHINVDPQMVHEGVFALARSADIVDELGQVDFVFSDKTGTLTENEMRFARCCVLGEDLGEFRQNCLPKGGAQSETTAGVANVRRILEAQATPERTRGTAQEEDSANRLAPRLQCFFLSLVLCSTVQVEFEGNEAKYLGSSPDEVALVSAAHRVGISLVERIFNNGKWSVKVRLAAEGCERSYRIEHEVEFSSERKRMSVIAVSDNGEILCITKGADNVLVPLCSNSPLQESDLKNIQDYAVQGLRTLVVASRPLDHAFLTQWQQELTAARSADLAVRQDRIADVAARLEVSLDFVGITAVEDRLQMGVPQAIRSIKAAGIRFWVLTGDKTETAVEIARSCGLFVDGMVVAFVKGVKTMEQAQEMFEEAEKMLAANAAGANAETGMVLDGTVVEMVSQSLPMRGMFYRLAVQTKACVCCRLSPAQKRRLVEMVRAEEPSAITLAIGDGANDVSMIQGAQVGIGVRGKEGSQAVQACDIAIGQFRFLVPLLFCHGRRAYRRVAVFLCWYIYKHLAVILGDIIWACQSGFKGDRAYPEWLSSGYTIFFTSLSVICTLSFDRDVSDTDANSHPILYAEGPQRAQFNFNVFTGWMISGVWHGAVAWLGPNLVFGGTDPKKNEFWMAAGTSFSLVVLIVTMKLFLITLTRFNMPTILSFASAAAAYILYLFCLGHVPLGHSMQPEMEGIPVDMVTDDESVLTFFICPLVALAPDFVYYFVRQSLRPTPLERLRRKSNSRLVVPEAEQTPGEVNDKVDGADHNSNSTTTPGGYCGEPCVPKMSPTHCSADHTSN